MVGRERLTMVEISMPWDELSRLVASSPFSRLPVYRGTRDMVVGMLRVKDLVHRFLREGAGVPLSRLVRPILRVPRSMAADELIATLRRQRSHQAAVVDDHGAVVGLVTIQDVISEFLGPRERQA